MRGRTVTLALSLALACLLAPRSGWSQPELQSRHFTTSDSVELHYLEAGSGPPMVFVPGWTMPAWIWEPQLERFAESRRVVALDPRGQGRSEKPTEGYHAARRAGDVCELLDHLGGEPAVVVAWSIAVQEVVVCADEFGTEDIRALVLVDHPVDLESDREFARSRIQNLQGDRQAWTRSFVEAIHQSDRGDEYLEALTRAALSTPTNAAAIMIANVYFLGPTDLRPALEDLDRPVLFVYSSLDWALAAADEVRTRFPGMPVEIIDETSHALFRDKPDEFNQVLEEFLVTLPER